MIFFYGALIGKCDPGTINCYFNPVYKKNGIPAKENILMLNYCKISFSMIFCFYVTLGDFLQKCDLLTLHIHIFTNVTTNV